MKNGTRFTKRLMVLLATVVMILAMAMPASAATKIKMNATKATVTAGLTKQLKVSGTKAKITWSSSNKSVATVNSKGLVTTKKAGTATITAKAGKQKCTCKITVKTNALNCRMAPWNQLSYSSGINYVKAQPVRYYYDSNRNLVVKFAVGNLNAFYNYRLTNLKCTLRTKSNNQVIAQGEGRYNWTIRNSSYDYVTLVFNNGGTKKVVDLTKNSIKFSVSTN